METYRILFTGVGRRVELIQAFRQAATSLDMSLKIYGADLTESAPALVFCDYGRKVCGMKDADYIPQLLKICREDRINLLIPTIDTDLLTLSQNAEQFDEIGTKVLISQSDKIAICRDKNLTSEFFEACGLNAPQTVNDYQRYSGPYPCFIKPKDGSSSINAFKVQNESELSVYARQLGDYIIQPFIDGTEYTVDIFCDYDGNPIHITPRIRLAVRSGEVLKTEISMDSQIIEESRKVIERFKPCGPITVQLIRQKSTRDDYFIEINPRFGGGAPLSMKAGARAAESLLQIMRGEYVEYQENVDTGAIYSRFDQSVRIGEGSHGQKIRGVIFDLDDTLYSEKEYVRSGFKAVARWLGDEGFSDKLWIYFEEGKAAIDELLHELKCEEKKAQCLEISELMQSLKKRGIKIGIITDGRVSGQRKKIKALGLEEIVDDIIITDELGGVQFRKPCDIAFRIMQNRWRIPYEQMVYVGDNLDKDFQAPRRLGMGSVWFKNDEGLYKNKHLNKVAIAKEIKDLYQINLLLENIEN